MRRVTSSCPRWLLFLNVHVAWIDNELGDFMVGIVDETSSRINLQGGSYDHKDVGLAHDVNSDIHTVNLLAKHNNVRTHL